MNNEDELVDDFIPPRPDIRKEDLYLTSDELQFGLFNKQQLQKLRTDNKHATLTREHAKRAKEMAKRLNPHALRQLAEARIRHISDIARQELTSRKTNGMT